MRVIPVHVNVPYPLLKERAGFLIEKRLNPEIYLSGNTLDRISEAEFADDCTRLREAGLSITFHAPYVDMSAGTPDLKIRAVVQERLLHVMKLAELARPRVIVVHGAYDRWRFDSNIDMWFDNSMHIWPHIVRIAERIRTVIAMENVFDDTPGPLRRLLEEINSPNLGHCFDVGHFRLFSRVSMEEWFDVLGKWIAEVHIHDNKGTRDDHLPPGDGDIDFEKFFRLLKEYSPDAVHTIEPHREDHLQRNLEVLPRLIGPVSP